MNKFGDYSAARANVSGSDDDCVTVLDSEPLTGDNFTASPEVIILEDEATPTQRTLESTRESRKRHRTSIEVVGQSKADLQDQVRNLMRQNSHPSAKLRPIPTFGRRESSFGLGKPAAKKACVMTEVQGHDGFVRPEGGPGMWDNLLR